MTQAFDAAALRAAIKAAGEHAPRAITIPGVGKAYKRELTVADVDEAQALRLQLAKEHPELGKDRLGIAIGLAQTLCGPDGTRIFDPRDAADIALLAKVPWASARGVTADDESEEGAEKNA